MNQCVEPLTEWDMSYVMADLAENGCKVLKTTYTDNQSSAWSRHVRGPVADFGSSSAAFFFLLPRPLSP